MTGWSSRLFRCFVGLALAMIAPGLRAAEPTEPAAPQEASPPEQASEPPASAGLQPANQQPASTANSNKAIGPSGELEIFYVPDPQNPTRLAPLLGMDLGQLRQAWSALQNLAAEAAAPAYSLNELALQGEVQGPFAALEAEIAVVVDRSDWVRVPLRMTQAIARTALEHEGPGEFRCHFEPQQGWVAWLRAPTGSEHTLRWKIVVPVTTDAARSMLRLALPAAAVANLRVTVPGKENTAELAGGVGQLEQGLSDAATTWTLHGAQGDVDLRWGPAAAASASTSRLVVEQWLYVEPDRGRARLHNRLSVQRPGEPLGQFSVRLPAGVRWSPQFPTGVTVREQSATADGRQVLNVEIESPTATAAVVELSAEAPFEEMADTAQLEIAAWEVPGATGAAGFVAIGNADRWQLDVQKAAGLRPLDSALLPLEFQRREITAAYALLGGPVDLQASLTQRPAQVTVAPKYQLEVAADEAVLRGSLKYTLRGPEPPPLRLATNGWTIERFAPVGGEGSPLPADADEVVAPAPSRGDESSAEFVMEVTARRAWSEAGEVSWPLPLPQGAEVKPVVVTVSTAENIQWTAAEESSSDWTQVTEADAKTERRDGATTWRTARPEAPLTASLQVLPQEVSVTALSRATLEQQAAQIEQLFDYQIRHVPAAELALQVPAELATTPGLECALNGQPLAPAAWTVAPASNVGEGARLRVRLPAPRTGQWQLTVRYRVAVEPLAADVTRRWELPLLAPLQGDVESNRLVVSGKSTMRIQPDASGPWQPSDDGRKGQHAPAMRLVSTTVPDRAVLLVTLDAHAAAAAVVVERALIQTNYLGETAVVRSIFRLLASEGRVAFTLPAGAVANSLEVRLDGEPSSYRVTSTGGVELSWPDDAPARWHVVELRTTLAGDMPSVGAAQFDMPRLTGPAVVHRLYWQLLLPSQMHLLDDPPGWLSEQRWAWHGAAFARQCVLDQGQLEEWVGASRSPALPRTVNAYLFSAFSAPSQAKAPVASRSWLILSASGLTLALGLAVLYWPRLRRPWVLLSAGLLLAGGSLLRPDAAILIGQAALAGAVLVLVAAWLSRPAPVVGGASTLIKTPRGSSIVQRGGSPSSRPTTLRPASAGSPATTQSAPVPLVVPDSHA